MKVIALSGWKGSGKDTLAAHMIKEHSALRTAFADPLKDMVAKEYKVDRTWMDDPAYKEAPLPQYPVNPQDRFSKMIAEFLIKEFRFEQSNIVPHGFTYIDGKFMGYTIDLDGLQRTLPVYWTPRALCIFKGSGNRSVTSQYWVQKAISDIKEKDENYPFRVHVVTDLRFRSEVAQLKEAFGRDLLVVRINRFANSPSDDPSERDLDDHQFDKYIENHGSIEEAQMQIDQIIRKLPT